MNWVFTTFLIEFAFITGNSSLEPLLEGLLAQIQVNLSWRVFSRNRTEDLRIPKFFESRALHQWAKVTDDSLRILQDPLIAKKQTIKQFFLDISKTKTVGEKSVPVSDIVSRIPLSEICSDIQILSCRGAWSDQHSLQTTRITASKLGRLRDSFLGPTWLIGCPLPA